MGNPFGNQCRWMEVTYREGDVQIRVKRTLDNNGLVERYTFTNRGKETIYVHDMGIYTPFNDNYPSAQQCINSRTNVHIWEGENAAYVNALRMGAFAPHLGLVVTQGAVKSYEIWERGPKKQTHTREVFLP